MKLDDVKRGDWTLAAVALLLVIDLLVLPWFDVGIGPISVTRTATGAPDGWLGVLAVLAALALIADLAVERLSPQTNLPALAGSRSLTRLALAGAAALFVALKFLFHVHFSLFGLGFWAAAVLAVGLVVAAARAHGGGPLGLLTGILAVIALLTSGCGAASHTATTTPATTPTVSARAAADTTTHATTHAVRPKAASTKPASGLSGTWSGQYGGAFSGTFSLDWTQSGSNLSGTIKLSTPPDTTSVHGRLSGGTIQFGTVGSMAITYTGAVSGGSMSGSYQTPRGGGSWSATKG